MKVLVAVKRVVDYNVKVRVKADGSGVELANVKMSMNPFDEIAVEEASRLKEAGSRQRSSRSRSGPQQAQETIRTALAMGADRGILIKHDEYGTAGVAKLLKAVVEEDRPELVILGKQAIDDDMQPDRPDAGCAAGLVAGHLRLEGRTGRRQCQRTREIDGGLQTIKVKMPTIVTTRPAPQRAALCLAAEHHEGQEKAAR